MKICAVIGLGYVGLGLAVSLSKKYQVIGYDINVERILALQNNIDNNQLMEQQELQTANITYTSQLQDLARANFYIISVSTPAYFYEMPNLEPLILAVQQLGTIIKVNDIIVFE